MNERPFEPNKDRQEAVGRRGLLFLAGSVGLSAAVSGCSREAAVPHLVDISATPESVGAVGDGSTDDASAFRTLFAHNRAALLRNTYRLDYLTVENAEIRGEHYNTLRAATELPILRLRSGSTIDNVTIDGEGAKSRRVDIGGPSDENIAIRDVVIANCPTNSFRVIDNTSGVRMVNVYATNSKVFNTNDNSTAKNLLFIGIICVNSPQEAFLLDFPDSTPDWTGFLIGQSIWELALGSKRAIGIARAVGGLVAGQVIRGSGGASDPADSDLIHLEDKAQLIAIVGNVMETNGSVYGTDIAMNGEPSRDPKELLLTSNLYKATDSNTKSLIHLEGSAPSALTKTSVVGEMLLCNGVSAPLQILATSGVYGSNHIFDAIAPEHVRTNASGDGGSGADVLRLPSHYVNPHFLRGDQGHGFNPDNVIFRTTFGFDGYENFQKWATAVRTITGASIVTFEGSVGAEGSITFPIDSTTGASYLRATRGSSSLTTRMNLIWNVHDVDFQNLDSFCVRILTRSSVRTAGKLELSMPFAGPSPVVTDLNSTDDYKSWKSDGSSMIAPSSTNFYATGAGVIQASILLGENLSSPGVSCDFGVLAVSVSRSTPF